MEVVLLVARLFDCASKFDRTLATVGEVRAHRDAGASGLGDLADRVVLALVVGREAVDRHDRRDTVSLHVLDLLAQVLATRFDVGRVVSKELRWERLASDDLVLARVSLQRAHRRDEHSGIGNETRGAALDVEEALRTHVCTEAGLGDEVVTTVDADQVTDDG